MRCRWGGGANPATAVVPAQAEKVLRGHQFCFFKSDVHQMSWSNASAGIAMRQSVACFMDIVTGA